MVLGPVAKQTQLQSSYYLHHQLWEKNTYILKWFVKK